MKNSERGTSLRERVFEACQNIESNGEKVTRETVRAITGGSYRDLSKYISEWRDSGKLLVQEIPDSQPTLTENSPSVMVNGTDDIELLENPPVDTHADIAKIARQGAKVAAGVIVTEKVIVAHFLKHPHQLPDDLKQEINQAISNIDSDLEQHYQQRYNSDSLTQQVLQHIKKK